jgi:hypothetical protein
MGERDNYRSNEWAVSETIGFVIIFGIMLTGIALVTLYGYPMLVQEQQNTNIRNMERNMIVLQNDLKGLTYKNVPYKETMLQVSGGTMLIQKEPMVDGGMNSSFTVDVFGNSTNQLIFKTGGIIYTSQDTSTTISLENDAVHTRFWSSPAGSAMLAEPRWFYDEYEPTKTFVISFITLNASDYFAQTGIGTVRMRLDDANQTEYIVTGHPSKIIYDADTENNYNIAWRNYMESPELKMNFIPGESGGFRSTFSLDPNVDKLIIKRFNVTVLSL